MVIVQWYRTAPLNHIPIETTDYQNTLLKRIGSMTCFQIRTGFIKDAHYRYYSQLLCIASLLYKYLQRFTNQHC